MNWAELKYLLRLWLAEKLLFWYLLIAPADTVPDDLLVAIADYARAVLVEHDE